MSASDRQFSAHPLAWLSTAFAAGITLVHVCPLPFFTCLLGGGIFSLSVMVALARLQLRLATVLLIIAFTFAGATLALIEQRDMAADRVARLYDAGFIASDAPIEVTGVLERAPEVAPDGLFLALRVESLNSNDVERTASGVVQLFAPMRDAQTRTGYEELELRRGARVRILTMLERAESFRNPGGSSLTEFLERRGFDATGFVKSPLLCERLDDERVFVPLVWLDAWREDIRAKMVQMFSAETAGVLEAALLGNRYGLSHASAERFRAGGTFHVLVISGLHITFIGGAIFALMKLLTKRRAWQFAVSVVFLWAYAVAVGAGASVVRAALMFTLMALAPILARRASTLNALGAASLALLIWHPGDLFDPSFQLTFLSVLSIVTLGWPLLQKLGEVGAWRPTSETPYPPACLHWWRVLGESLFWSERAWRRELEQNLYTYRLFKTGAARVLDRWRVQRLLRFAFGLMIISATVQLGMLPLLVLYFHRLSFAAIVLNIVVGTLMATLALCALASLLVSYSSLKFASTLVLFTEKLNWLMTHSVDPFVRAHVASLRLPEYHGWAASVYVLYYVPLIALAVALARWHPVCSPQILDQQKNSIERAVRQVAWTLLAGALFLIIFHPWSAGRADGRLRIDFLDVGQGDSALVTFPDNTTLLVDGGGRPNFIRPKKMETVEDNDETHEPFARDTRSVGEAVVSEYLWWRGLDRVDYLLATHAHADHIDGLNDVLHNFRVRSAIVGRTPALVSEYARFAATLEDEGVPLLIVNRGDTLRLGAVTIDALWPPRIADEINAPSGNNDSIVLRLRYGERTFLLTGDLEAEGEGALLAGQDDLRADVVKVGHHGSQTSSTAAFVAAVRPSLAIISVGLTSPFGHPSQTVVERWQASGAKIMQTGRSGTISVSSDGRDLKIETFVRE